MILLHAGVDSRRFVIPPGVRALPWRRLIDTAAAGTDDVHPDLDGPPPPADGSVELESRSLVVYVARDEL